MKTVLLLNIIVLVLYWQIEEAREVLHRIRNEGVEEELQEIQDAVQQSSQLFGFRTALKK